MTSASVSFRTKSGPIRFIKFHFKIFEIPNDETTGNIHIPSHYIIHISESILLSLHDLSSTKYRPYFTLAILHSGYCILFHHFSSNNLEHAWSIGCIILGFNDFVNFLKK